MLARLRSVARGLFGRQRFEETMADELRFHMEAFADDLVRSGVPREEALRRARLEFGGVESVKEHCRQARGLRVFDELWQDLRYGVRAMANAPIVTAAAIASLALGIGANTALFGFVDAVFLRMLPVHNPHELYYFAHHSGPQASSNYPLFERYRALDAFSGVTAYMVGTFRVVTPEAVEPVTGQFVSGNYHGVLGMPLARGRGFSREPDRDLSRTPVAVISDAYWARRFGRSPSAVGSRVNVNGRTVEIVGITQPGFYGLESESRIDITLPISVVALDQPDFFDDHSGWMSLRLVGRLRAGTTEAQALAAADGVFQRYMSEPEQQWVRDSLPSDRFRSAALLAAGKGSAGRRERTATPIRLLMAMAGVVLLIACANVANLLLARGAARRREMAMRVSIGAGRGRLVRQLLTEGLLLAMCGGALGVVVAVWTSGAMLSLFDGGPVPFLLDLTMNARVLAFTIAVSMLTGAGFGLLPALTATRVDAVPALKSSPVAARGGRRMGGRLLVASQIALCLLLLVAAGLLGRSVRNLRTLEAGFERASVVLADVNTRGAGFSPETRMALYASVVERLHSLPGVRSLSLSTRTPIDSSSRMQRIDVPGFQAPGRHGVSTNVVAPGYFRTFGIRLVRGREFTMADRATAPSVAIVSESMARFYFGDVDPIGRIFFQGSKNSTTIVGVVEDVRHERLTLEDAPKMVYTLLAQTPSIVTLEGDSAVPEVVTLAMRIDSDSSGLAAAVREHIRRIDRNAMVSYVRTFEQQLDAAVVRERLLATLSAAFGGFALLLACVGLYGTMSYSVARRSREIAIRMALGAARVTVLRQVLREGLIVSAVGVAVGAIAAFWITGVMSAVLFQVSPRDPLTLAAAVGVLLTTALAAGFLPARRAATVDPSGVLKAD